MGFMFSDQDHNDKADERMLFADFWKCLKGDENDGVSIENLKRLLLSIEGLFQSKQKDYPFECKQSKKDCKINYFERIFKNNCKDLKKISNDDSKNSSKKPLSSLIEYDSKGIMRLNDALIIKIRKYFMTFAQNRSKFTNQKMKLKHSSRNSLISYSHRPSIDEKSRKIVKNLHSKLNEMKIPHYELLLYKGKEYDKKKEMNMIKHNIQPNEPEVIDSGKTKGRTVSSKNSKIENSNQDDYLESKTNSKQSYSASESSGIVIREAKVEELNNMVIMKKGTDINEYLDPNYYDSNNPSPEIKELRGLSVENRISLGQLQSPFEHQYDSSQFLTTSPILEEDYSDSMEHSSEINQEIIREVDINQQPFPILFVDINLGKSRVERLTVFDGDNPRDVSKEFAERTGINEKMRVKLENMLQEQLTGLLTRINEVEDDEECV